ncbi:MAG: TRAP transporter large permease subunit [Treponema sp.]|jgi:tripartite ATP-independent transporter DctM subunit|nr:TRAP transporter large permease subunit [Treponema sp.]
MHKKQSILWTIEGGICYFFLVALALLPMAEAVARLCFRTGVPDSSNLMVHCLLVLGLLSGMITTRNGEHLSIALAQYFLRDQLKKPLLIVTSLLSAFVVTIIAWCGASFVSIALSPWQMIGFIPDQVFALIIPLGYGIIAFRFARMTPVTGAARCLPVLAIVLGTVCSLPAIAKLIWGFDVPDRVYDLTDAFVTLAMYVKVPAVIILLLAALAGTPLFVIMGGMALILIQASGGEIDVVANQVYTGLTQNSFIAIPLFTLAGFFLSESKAGERLVLTFRSLFSWLPGGMIIATVVICAFFTSFTGASGVTILALGGILYTILSDHVQYPEKFSIGLLTSVGSIGLLFPPSLPIILVGAKTRTNIIHMFVGGIFPGLLLVLAVIVFGIIISIKIKIPVEPFEPKKALSALKHSVLEILLPLVLIAGYFSGILSLIEIGAVAVVYVFVAEVLIHRDIRIRDVPQVFRKAIPIIGGVLSILALSQALSYYIVDTQVPENLVRWMQNAIHSKYLFLLLLNLALLVVGCLMDIFSAILVVLPLVAPLGIAYGIDPVHLGIIFITNLEVGFLTPPVGMNLFLASYRFKRSFVDICRYVFPFLFIQMVVVILVTYVPWLSTYLIRFF